MVNIIVTFDYELFFGENYGSYEKVLFEPTNKLLEILKKNEITSTFFVDVCSINAFKRNNLFEYVDGFEKQIKKMIDSKQDVQLHLHPSWINANYSEGKWEFDNSHYTLHSYGFNEKEYNAYNVIDDGIEYLTGLCNKHNDDYKCVAFRAGGFSIQPHSEVVTHMRNRGILIDSSVCQDLFCESSTLNYDFRNMPTEINWWLTPGREFNYMGRSEEGGLYEIPMLSDKNSLLKKLFIKEYSKDIKQEPLLGSFVKLDNRNDYKRNMLHRLKQYMSSYGLVSFDSMPCYRMINYFDHFFSKLEKKDVYVSIICHPKMIDDGVLRNMESIISALKKRDYVRFLNMREAYDRLSASVDEKE